MGIYIDNINDYISNTVNNYIDTMVEVSGGFVKDYNKDNDAIMIAEDLVSDEEDGYLTNFDYKRYLKVDDNKLIEYNLNVYSNYASLYYNERTYTKDCVSKEMVIDIYKQDYNVVMYMLRSTKTNNFKDEKLSFNDVDKLPDSTDDYSIDYKDFDSVDDKSLLEGINNITKKSKLKKKLIKK